MGHEPVVLLVGLRSQLGLYRLGYHDAGAGRSISICPQLYDTPPPRWKTAALCTSSAIPSVVNTGCGFEYAHHTAVGLRWFADVLEGTASPAPAPPTEDPDRHEDPCREWSRAMVIDHIEAGVSAMLPSVRRHEAGDQPGPSAVSFGAFELSRGTALRHGLHDSEHLMWTFSLCNSNCFLLAHNRPIRRDSSFPGRQD